MWKSGLFGIGPFPHPYLAANMPDQRPNLAGPKQKGLVSHRFGNPESWGVRIGLFCYGKIGLFETRTRSRLYRIAIFGHKSGPYQINAISRLNWIPGGFWLPTPNLKDFQLAVALDLHLDFRFWSKISDRPNFFVF